MALRIPSGDFTSSDGKAAQHLLMTHFPGCQSIEEHHSSGRVLWAVGVWLHAACMEGSEGYIFT
jgi:hypothetical protein